MKRIAVLGSTGSIGRQTLEVVAAHPERLQVVALAARRNVRLLEEQVRTFRPSRVALQDKAAAAELRTRLSDLEVQVLAGEEGLEEVARGPADQVVSALVGAAGLAPTLAALRAGISVALANKESLVMAGGLIKREAERSGAGIIPVDSEHSAIWQSLRGEPREHVRKLILTASGGPFLRTPPEAMARVRPQEALRHPRWEMGAKITVDSATLMNKGLEVIEAHWLFDQPFERIEVLIHPESIVHSLVEMIDGSVLAQLGRPDMRLPIQYALSYPERWEGRVQPRLDLAAVGALHFEVPDAERFPCLRLAYQAGRLGGTAPAVLNAANEVAVHAFLEERIPFLAIPRVVEHCLERHEVEAAPELEGILGADEWARREARRMVERWR
ncbi:MAG: 1-deoxy-D-xylulose-5-phosphate reductoisomerase [Bacillota bacterium]|nr:1-deoxy-D-xylulose-5-phosphate reductoisomerase [Bacillota bacterium]